MHLANKKKKSHHRFQNAYTDSPGHSIYMLETKKPNLTMLTLNSSRSYYKEDAHNRRTNQNLTHFILFCRNQVIIPIKHVIKNYILLKCESMPGLVVQTSYWGDQGNKIPRSIRTKLERPCFKSKVEKIDLGMAACC